MSSSQGSYVEVKMVPGNPNIYEIKNIDNQSQINDILSRKNDAEVKAQRTFSDRASELGSRVGSYLPAMPQMPWDSYSKNFKSIGDGNPSNPSLLTDAPGTQYKLAPTPAINRSEEGDTRISGDQLGGGSSKKHKTRKRKRQKKTKKKRNRKSKIGKQRNHRKSKKV